MNDWLFRRLKYEFYDWCATLSIDECVSNEPLIAAIEHMERLLISTTNWLDAKKGI